MIMADSFIVASRIQVKVVETCDNFYGIGVGHDTDANDRSLCSSWCLGEGRFPVRTRPLRTVTQMCGAAQG
jgi:hypothetical protein